MCLLLAQRPVNATHLMKRMPRKKNRVMELSPALQRWVSNRLRLDSILRAEPASLASGSVKKIAVQTRSYEALIRHAPRVVRLFLRKLAELRWNILPTSANGLYADLVAFDSRTGHLLLVEAKACERGKTRDAVRYAIGQLLDYSHFVLPTLPEWKRKRRLTRMVLLERPTLKELVHFLESHGLGIAWYAGKRIACGPGTRRSLPSALWN